MEIVYIETTIVSYLVANPSREVVTAGQQQATRNWWNRRRDLFQCVTSDETLAEAARGDAETRKPSSSKISSPADSGWPAWEGRSSQDTARSNGRA